MRFSEWMKRDQINSIAKKAGLDVSKYSTEELAAGYEEELEHGKKNKALNVTANDPVKTLKIVLAHMKEDPHYYKKLKQAMRPRRPTGRSHQA